MKVLSSSTAANAIVAAAAKVSVFDPLAAIEAGKKTHLCPWLHTARHIEQFDYYHPTRDILVKPCCSLRPQDPKDFQLDTGTAEKNIARMAQEFKQGQWPIECQVCHQEEDQGMVSERLRAFEANIARPDAMSAIRHIHLKFSNLCNMACRVCTTTESTLYGRTVETQDPSVFTQADITQHRDWSMLLDYIECRILASDPIKICLVGGETTLAPGVQVLAQWLIDRGHIKRVEFVFSSNCLNMPDRLLDLLAQSAGVVIAASLDSTHDNFHYVRWPGTWQRATATVDKILAYRREHNVDITLQISPNFNINNIFYLDDFLDYWSDHEYDSMMVFNVYAPEVFRVDTLPAYMRPAILERLKACLDHRFFAQDRDTKAVMSWLLTTIERLSDLSNVDEILWNRYLVVNAEFDHVTDTRLWDYNSRLAQAMSRDDAEYYHQALTSAAQSRITEKPGMLFDRTSSQWNLIPIRTNYMEKTC